MPFKMIGATPKSGKSLCETCKHARFVRGQNLEERIICGGGMFVTPEGDQGPVRFKVADCSMYHPANHPFLHEMKQIAWNVEARHRGPVGFEPGQSDMEVIVTPPKKKHDPLDQY